MPRLSGYVYLVRDGVQHLLGPGDEVPEWAEVTNPDLLEGDEGDKPEGDEPEGDEPEGGKPKAEKPHGNASLEAWQKYAREQGASDADIAGKTRDELKSQF